VILPEIIKIINNPNVFKQTSINDILESIKIALLQDFNSCKDLAEIIQRLLLTNELHQVALTN
jgi:hypothetical protein